MNIGIVVFVSITVVLFMMLVFVLGSLYGLSGETNIISWIKLEIREIKDSIEEEKAERAFIKANPLCSKCLENGEYRRSEYMWTHGARPIPYCRECYQQELKDYLGGLIRENEMDTSDK